MGNDTSIEWTDATWNPVRGCSRVSPGCENCYAERVAVRFSGPGQAYEGLADRATGRWTRKVRLVPEHLADPLRWQKPRRIFVNSMSDLFHESLSNEDIAAVFGVMAAAPQHTFQVLTKRAERMREWFRWAEATARERVPTAPSPANAVCAFGHVMVGDEYLRALDSARPVRWPLPNVWLGVSVEDQQRANERIPLLLQTPAAVRFLSCEPLLGPVNFLPSWVAGYDFSGGRKVTAPRIDWVIVGGESGQGARPFRLEWARRIVEQGRAAGVPCFVKQLGARPQEGTVRADGTVHPDGTYRRFAFNNHKGGDPAEWPADLRVREFPEAKNP